MVNFARKKSFLDLYLVYNRFCFKILRAKVRNGHFWTILKKFRVLMILNGLNEKFLTQFVGKCSPKYLETIKKLSFQKSLKNCRFYTMSLEVTCFEIGFKNCILKIGNIYLYSKFFFNQKISEDSSNSR